MTDITIFITPHTITSIKHCRRIRLYIIRILVWIPNGEVGQSSGRLHGNERFRLKFISSGIVYHQNGSLYGYSFGRPFPFAAQRHTCRNIKFPGNTITAGRSKKHTTTPVLTQFVKCRLENTPRVFHSGRICSKVSYNVIRCHTDVICRIFIRHNQFPVTRLII